jgi:SAM-dependent methyltransferase
MYRLRTWRDFWNTEHKIYVSSRHKKVHYEAIARDVLELLPQNRPRILLDFGCGDALCAPAFVAEGLEVLLYDPIPFVQERIEKSFANKINIKVLADRVENIQSNSVDVVLINSVLQYISKNEFESLLSLFKKIMKADGLLIIADVVPDDMSVLQDVISLMRSAWRHHFIFSAVRGLIATFFSDYHSICRNQGFATYAEKEMLEILSRHNFAAERKQNNVGLTSHRMTFCAKPR